MLELIPVEKIIGMHLSFTRRAFPLSTSKGALTHLKREIEEIEQEIELGDKSSVEKKEEEFADALGCLLDAAQREGIYFLKIIDALYNKIQVNKKREWKYNGDGSYSHIKNQQNEKLG